MLFALIAIVLCIYFLGMLGESFSVTAHDDMQLPTLWWILSIIISCGTLAALLIPEFTKIFTSSKSAHVQEVVTALREGRTSLNILSGIVAGNFSVFWTVMLIVGLMTIAYFI